MRSVSIALLVSLLLVGAVRAQTECLSEIFGTVQHGQKAYAGCEDSMDGFRWALCENGELSVNEDECFSRSATVFSYGVTSVNWFVGDAVNALTLLTDDASLKDFAIAPELPSGLDFNTSNGVISGLPTVATEAATYTITAGDQTTQLEITISNVVCPAMDSFPETISGETATSTSACPAGMQGTATRVCNNGHFGDINTSACTILPTSGLSYSPYSINVQVGEAVFAKPSYSNTASTFTISPSLPAGLTLSAAGTISGKASAVMSYTTYTISASNESGQNPVTAVVYITITAASCAGLEDDNGNLSTVPNGGSLTLNCPTGLDGSAARVCTNGKFSETVNTNACYYGKPMGFNYSPNIFTLHPNEELNTGRPSFTGVANYFTITPALPEGFTLDAETGVISGVSTVVTVYSGTVKAKATQFAPSEASTTITINVKNPTCAATEDLSEVAVGSSTKFTCPEGYEGVMVRKCTKKGTSAQWGLADVHCQPVQDYTFLIIGVVVFVICLIVLLVGCIVKSSRTRSKSKKTLPSTKTAPKAPKAAATKTASKAAPKPAAKVTI